MTAAARTATTVTVIGEALVDVVRRAGGAVEELPGGSPANVAITLGRLERAPRLVTCLGDDDRGHRVRSWLETSDVEVHAAPLPRTSTALVRLDATGAATYEFDLAWDLGEVTVPPGQVLHVGSIAAVLEPGGTAVLEAVRAASGLVTYDPNVRPTITPDRDVTRARVEEIVVVADVVKVSDEDLAWLVPAAEPAETAARWSRSGPALVVMTAGGDGSILLRDGEQVARIPVPAVTVVDTVGAGDTYMGGLIDGLLALGLDAADRLVAASTARLEAACAHAARSAAVTVSRPGADPPRRDELGLPHR